MFCRVIFYLNYCILPETSRKVLGKQKSAESNKLGKQLANTRLSMNESTDNEEPAMAAFNGFPPQSQNFIVAVNASGSKYKGFTLSFINYRLFQKEHHSEMRDQKNSKAWVVFDLLSNGVDFGHNADKEIESGPKLASKYRFTNLGHKWHTAHCCWGRDSILCRTSVLSEMDSEAMKIKWVYSLGD